MNEVLMIVANGVLGTWLSFFMIALFAVLGHLTTKQREKGKYVVAFVIAYLVLFFGFRDAQFSYLTLNSCDFLHGCQPRVELARNVYVLQRGLDHLLTSVPAYFLGLWFGFRKNKG